MVTRWKRTGSHPWLEVPGNILTKKLEDQDRAFQASFEGRGKYPQFKRKRDRQSERVNLDAKHNGKRLAWANGDIVTPTIGELRVRGRKGDTSSTAIDWKPRKSIRGANVSESRSEIREGRAWCVYMALYVAPALWLATEVPGYAYWLVSASGIALLSTWLGAAPNRRPVLASAIGGLATLGSIPFVVSLYIQGTGFNERFFLHADAESLAMAWQAYTVEVLIVAAYWAAITAAPLWIARVGTNVWSTTIPRPAMAAAALAGVLAYAPAISIGQYAHARARAADAPIMPITTAHLPEPAHAQPTQGYPSLLMIVAESLEATFGDAAVMGKDLTPKLTALEREGLRFTDIRQLRNASWTMAGIVASQCATPLPVSEDWFIPGPGDSARATATAASERIHPDRECLGDILKRHGYRTVYYSSAALAFAGVGAFLASHGFDEQYGWKELRAVVPDADAHSAWGLHDADVIDIVWRRLETLAEEQESQRPPFALMLSTIDTHDAGTQNVSRWCGRRPLVSGETFGLDCADRLLTDFIQRVRLRWPNIVVVLMSDHLALDPNTIVDRMRDRNARRVRFALWAPGEAPGSIDRPGTHLDIGPTVLDALGLDTYQRLNHGASLLAFESPWLSHENPQALRAAPPLLAVAIEPGERVAFEKAGPIIRIDGKRILANRHGLALENAVFTMRFHDDGSFDTTVAWQEFDELEEHVTGALVVGVSTNDRFNRDIGNESKSDITYFAGRIGSEAGVMTGTVGEHTEIELAERIFGPLQQ